MQKLELLYEGKAKQVFGTDDPAYYWITYKDDATAFNGEKRGQISAKGVINNQLSALFFQELAKAGVSTHFVKVLGEREMLVQRLEMLPLEVVIRNVTAGSLAKRLGIEEGIRLSRPVVELYYKDDVLGDPFINESHIAAMEWADLEDVKKMQELGLQVNVLLQDILHQAGLTLIDFKLEFGKAGSKVILGDEISPDTCRFWDENTGEKLDKDRFRRDLGQVEEAYFEVYRRVREVVNHA